MLAMPELLARALRELREKREMSRKDLSFATVRLGYEGVPESTIESLEVKPGRVPDADTLEALAEALGVTPEHFYEWPIADARRGARDPAARLRAREDAAVQKARERQPSRPRTTRGRRGEEGRGQG